MSDYGKDTNISSKDTIYRQDAIDEIEYELEMINSALDSITLDFNARERLCQRKGEAREILNSIQQLTSAQPEIIRCKECINHGKEICYFWSHFYGTINTPDDGFCYKAERRTDA